MREVGMVTFVSLKYDLGEVHLMALFTLQGKKGHHLKGSNRTKQMQKENTEKNKIIDRLNRNLKTLETPRI